VAGAELQGSLGWTSLTLQAHGISPWCHRTASCCSACFCRQCRCLGGPGDLEHLGRGCCRRGDALEMG